MFINYSKGEIARLKVLLRAAEKGILVSEPIVEARYDLVFDIDSKLYKIQVKYADHAPTKVSGSVQLDLRKNTRGNTNKRTYSKDEIDAVLVYLPAVDKIIWLGPELFHEKSTITLRYTATLSGQKQKLNLIEDLIW